MTAFNILAVLANTIQICHKAIEISLDITPMGVVFLEVLVLFRSGIDYLFYGNRYDYMLY